MLIQRRSGILLHPTSLPGTQPVGSLGQEAYNFVDFLVSSGQSVWQILPLGPTGYGNCPYSSFSAFAGNPLLINLQLLAESENLPEFDLPTPPTETDTADFDTAVKTILPALHLAGENFKQNADSPRHQAFDRFCFDQAYWLNDYAFYEAMRKNQQYRGWQQWPQDIRQRQQSALHHWGIELQDDIYQHKYQQFIFFEQWSTLKKYANNKGIEIFGDLPIFVAEDSADVWANREQFYLDDKDQATLVAGVPPDYFSKTGQRWGNPLYRWERMAEDNFSWWLARFRWNLELFDLLRVDHFRGFSSCWAIPADEPTAVNGHWLEAPGEQLFARLQHELGSLPIVAEDLGIITPEVEQLRDRYTFPGMKVLQFAFDSGPDNPYLPPNHLSNSVIYTGTHDNNTTLGWWRSLDASGKKQVRDHLQNPCRKMPWPLIEAALSSVAKLAIIPLQDILSLPATSRMNTPGIATGNWQWRFQKDSLSAEIADKLKSRSHLYGRNLCIPAEM
ncbi:MAG: 4-alpha-glucanotransferase [Desulfuromusa sp.]|nr:4-alpha-glucanotransferase [Desulfuromusa sp.]